MATVSKQDRKDFEEVLHNFDSDPKNQKLIKKYSKKYPRGFLPGKPPDELQAAINKVIAQYRQSKLNWTNMLNCISYGKATTQTNKR